jgi:methylmalonyl-CoA mutase cobalamin-binding subunit
MEMGVTGIYGPGASTGKIIKEIRASLEPAE